MNPRQKARDALHWLTPPGTLRQKVRIHALRTIRRWLLPPRPNIFPRLPDWNAAPDVSRYCSLFSTDAEFGDAERVEFWIDFHPHVLSLFPLATTPVERDGFIAWLLTHREHFQLEGRDILAFARELADDPTLGLDFLVRRNPAWQEGDLVGLLAPAGDWVKTAVLPHEPAAARGVNVLGHFCYPSGLQVAALNTKAALEGAGWTVSCRDVPVNIRADRPGRRRWLGLHPHAATIVQLAPEPSGRNAYILAGLRERPGVRRIGYWYWELDTVPAAWARHADWLDEIWAPTRFVGDALRRVMPIPVHDVLPGIHVPQPSAKSRADFSLPADRFLFLFAFDMSSTAERKNPQGVLAAFQKAFSPTEPVGLVLKVNRGWEDPAALQSLLDAAEPGRILVLDEVLPADDMAALMNCCDSYVSLHRSEGFGLTLAEAMALGKPTIATRYSGNLDFMTDENSLLVECTMTTTTARAKAYPRGARWAEPSVDDAARKMRWVVEHPAEAREMAERGRRDVNDRLSLDAAGRRMSHRLEHTVSGEAGGDRRR